MPRPAPTQEQLDARRHLILEAAWRRFARHGFHASSMDQVIAEAGLSPGSVYRHFRGKDELIAASADEALGYARGVFDRLLADGAAPGPEELLTGLLTDLVTLADRDGYDLTRLALQVWSEAMRSPHVLDAAQRAYGELRGQFVEVARRWHAAGQLAPGADPLAVGQALFALVPGFILQRLLLQDVEPAAFAAGLAALGSWRPSTGMRGES